MRETIRRKKQYIVLSVLLCFMTVFGIVQYQRAQRLSYARDIEYNRVFAELTEYVDDIEVSLIKGQLVKSPMQISHFASELYRQASGAKASLALLPMNSFELEKTSQFLSQVGEYANCISQKSLRGEELSAEETSNIQKLTGYAGSLKKGLDEMLISINDGNVSFSDEKNHLKALTGNTTALASEFEALEEEFHNYPSLIYDGPFSQHLSLKEAQLTKGRAEISEKQAIKLAEKFIPENKKPKAEEVGGKLPSYSIKSGDTSVEYTKNGGLLLLMMKDALPGEAKLSLDEAKKKAAQFLSDNGFGNMCESYYENRSGSVVINYAYYQDGYIVYSDLVKVKVALDSGEVTGFEARGYIMNHLYRDIPDAVITEKQALECINDSLKTDKVSLAVIPLESGAEACCYQIRGEVSGRHFLVYVNTQTGDVEDMQILLETPGGVLAV